MTAFNKGVRVRVISGVWEGVDGTVEEYMDSNDFPKVRVKLDYGDNGTGMVFYPSSLRVLSEIKREEALQISRIEQVLREEGHTRGWSEMDYQSTAASLYRAGVRPKC